MIWEWEYLLKILITLVCASIIGAEREYTGKAAGLRTFILVGLGACIFAIVSYEIPKLFSAFDNEAILRIDPARIAAQIVVGIGFLGAGIIIFQESKERVKGLTTAAGLWLVAALGMAIGFGFYILPVVCAVLAFVVLTGFRSIETYLDKKAEKARGQRRINGLEE